LYFQTIDDKSECIGVYTNGKLHFDNLPTDLTRTWKYTGSLKHNDCDFAYLYAKGNTLKECCPANLQPSLEHSEKHLRAYLKSFKIAKINLRDHCIFDLVPEDFLKGFCEVKNKITEHVFETYEKPEHYAHLLSIHRLLHKISYQTLNLSNSSCKNLHMTSGRSLKAKKLLAGPQHIDYDLFGTVTGRLTTRKNSFPMLTIGKEFRQLLKPQNDWFLSLDYNAAEVRTFIALSGKEQPTVDVHDWHRSNLIKKDISREEAKVRFFAWIYNHSSSVTDFDSYDRNSVVEKNYSDGIITTPFKRKIKVDRFKALNYLIQSTTSDLVLERALAIDKFLEGKRSFISHIVHDEIVIDLAAAENDLSGDLKEIFAKNKLDTFRVNLKAGKDYYNLETLKL
jgi:hypothetical protein